MHHVETQVIYYLTGGAAWVIYEKSWVWDPIMANNITTTLRILFIVTISWFLKSTHQFIVRLGWWGLTRYLDQIFSLAGGSLTKSDTVIHLVGGYYPTWNGCGTNSTQILCVNPTVLQVTVGPKDEKLSIISAGAYSTNVDRLLESVKSMWVSIVSIMSVFVRRQTV